MNRLLKIDINADVGESSTEKVVGNDLELMPLISSANIACGLHAGDYNQMYKTINLAIKHGVAIGAHPGYDDKIGFGRQNIQLPDQELWNLLVYQLGALQAMTKALASTVTHVKPHGALYNQAAVDESIAKVIIKAVKTVMPDAILYGLAGSALLNLAEEHKLKVRHEYFIDRAYNEDGSLLERSISGAVITDVELAVSNCINKLILSNMRIDTVCVHGDSPNNINMVSKLQHELAKLGYSISAE